MYRGERFNSYSHLLGLVLVIFAAGVLLAHSLRVGMAAHIAGVATFAVSGATLYAASMLFHSTRGPRKSRWQRVDHAAIFTMIAGSYTAFALPVCTDMVDSGLLVLVWVCAIAGALREISGKHPPAVALYLGLGWVCMLGVLSFAARLGSACTAWLLAGAFAYSVGTVFFRNRSGWVHAHGTWHLFVLAGTACHYMALASTLRFWTA